MRLANYIRFKEKDNLDSAKEDIFLDPFNKKSYYKQRKKNNSKDYIVWSWVVELKTKVLKSLKAKVDSK